MSVFSNRAPRTSDVSEAYVRAVLDLIEEYDPLDVLSGTPTRLHTILSELSPHELALPESSGKWSAGQVVHHLADAELVWGYRFRRVLTEPAPRLSAYDQDVWAEQLGYTEGDPAHSATLFQWLRHANLRVVRRASDADLRKTAVHDERGEIALETMVRLWAGHDLIHLRQLSRILGAIK